MKQKIEMTTDAKASKFKLERRATFDAQPLPVPDPAATTVPAPDAIQDDESTLLCGYAIVWNATSSDSRLTRIAPQSVTFDPARPVLALYGHDDKQVLGSTANGTLKLTQDDYGLYVEILPPDTCAGRDICELVEDGYIGLEGGGMSFGMYELQGHNVQENGETIRICTKILVDEVTITAVPAFTQTSIAIADDDGELDPMTEQILKLEAYKFQELELPY